MTTSMPDLTEDRIVTNPRGSWKWQDAYRVVRYRLRQTRDGRIVWTASERLTGKMSEPQLRRAGWLPGTPRGSLHNVPFRFAPDVPDWRPAEMTSEDYHA